MISPRFTHGVNGETSFTLAVYADGSICLDILQNRWSPTYDVSSILTSIQVSAGLPRPLKDGKPKPRACVHKVHHSRSEVMENSFSLSI